MLNEAQVQEVVSIDTKSSNNLKNHFLEQVKKASDQHISMTSTSGKPNGESCVANYECESGRCSPSVTCDPVSGGCYLSLFCHEKLPNGESCKKDVDYISNNCEWSTSWGNFCADPPPPPPPSPGLCFSSETLVTHSERGLIPISEIEVGDYVLDSKFDGSFSRVFALEQNHYGESAFYQLLSSTGTLLELTDRLMVYLRNKALPVPARDIQIGDVLKSDEQDDMEVVEIKIIHRDGYYNPVTESGQILLNDGVVASSFSVARSSSSNFFDDATELIHWHTLSQLANAPLRFLCRVWFGFCANERFQNEEGLHKFIVLLKNASNLPKYQQFAVLPAIFGAGIMFTVLEFFYDQSEAFYKTTVTFVEAGSEGAASGVGGFSFLITCFFTVAALVPSVILVWRKKYHLPSHDK